MKSLSLILSLCLVGFAGAQTLVPDPEPDDIPESLFGEELDDPFATSLKDMKFISLFLHPL